MQPSAVLQLLLVASAAAAKSSSWSAGQEQAVAEYRNFLVAEWSTVESELGELQRVAGAIANATKLAANVTAPQANVTQPAKAARVLRHAGGAVDVKKVAVDAKKLAKELGLKAGLTDNPAMLAPMLGMLKGLYESGRQRIGQLNKQEKKQKDNFEMLKKRHDEKLKKIEARYKTHTPLAEELKHNATVLENKMYAYWPQVREREHRQYHNMLKLQHATMEKEKMMIDIYEKTIAGTADKKKVKTELGRLSGVMPEVVLAQAATSVSRFCAEALAEAAEARGELAVATF